MSFPQSKIGDQYNYEVAALLKFRGIPEFGPQFDFTQSSINPAPKPISKNTTLFENDVSFDIIASTAEWEYFIECKHSENPKPLTLKSQSVIESILEFLNIIPLRDSKYKEHRYLLVTNSSTKQLSESINTLQVSDEKEINDYIKILKKKIPEKWKNAKNIEKISIKDFRICLQKLDIQTIEDGEINSIRENSMFKEIFNNILKKIGQKIGKISPQLPDSAKLVLQYQDDDFISSLSSMPSYISRNFVQWLEKNINPSDSITEIDYNKIPENNKITLHHDESILQNQIESLLSTGINDYFLEKESSLAFVISIEKKRIYTFNPNWLYEKASSLKEPNHHLSLSKICENLSLPIGGDLLRLAIQEAYRISKGIYFASELFDD